MMETKTVQVTSIPVDQWSVLERIARVRNGAALAGIANPLIVLSSPWETVGGTKSGSAWYTTLAGIMREIARADSQVVFIDMRQYFADRYTTSAMYNASRTNVHMQMLADGVHPSVRGMIEYGQGSWAIINGGVQQSMLPGGGGSGASRSILGMIGN